MTNNNAPFSLPPQPLIFDPKLGYVTAKRIEKRNIRRDVNRLSFVSLCMFAASVFGSLLLSVMIVVGKINGVQGAENMISDSAEFYYLFAALMSILGIGVPFLIYFLVNRRPASLHLAFEKVGFCTSTLFAFAGCAVCLLGNIPAGWLAELVGHFGLSAESPPLPVAESPIAMVLMFFAIAVIPAVFEEFAFRGVLLSALRKYGDGFAIITSSVIFGLLHGSLTAIPFAVIAGLTMGYVYVRTGNLFVNIAIHFLNNAVAVVLENLTVHLPETTGLITTAIIFYGMILLGIVALIILCLKKKIHFHLQKPLLVLSGGQKLACVLSNPGFILFASICVTLCATALLGVPVL